MQVRHVTIYMTVEVDGRDIPLEGIVLGFDAFLYRYSFIEGVGTSSVEFTTDKVIITIASK